MIAPAYSTLLLNLPTRARRAACSCSAAALFCLAAASAAADLESVQSPLSPADSLKHLHARPGFVVELVAAEPLIADPVAFDWGPDGKLWVVEMHDYPLGLDGKGKPGGRVRFLEDQNGDGRYDRSTLFAEGLPYANGVLAWGKGVLVTCAPHILYLEDQDGNGKAEIRRPLFEGFTEGNPQLRVNGLRWGLDNWVHCANGFSSVGQIKSVKTGETLDIGGRDLRIRPEEGLLDATLGRSQYGRNRDAFGNWFGVNNANPLYHYALEDRYLRRNPHFIPPDPRIDVSIDPKQSAIFPRSKPSKFFHESQAGRFTSANSAIIFGDDLWGPEFAGNSYVSEPVHNLVHREIVAPKGVSFTSRRADDEQDSEFLASSDTWFRPATLRTGPDGALWVADMYRETVEHPQWIPVEVQEQLDLRAGSDKGRIYRVYPEAVKDKLRGVPRLDALEAAEIVALLESPNVARRDLAHQYLVTNQAASAAEQLARLAQRGKLPATRLQALCALEGLGKLPSPLLLQALQDSHGAVRRQAVEICEARLKAEPELGERLLALVGDQDPTVRLQLACTLGEWRDPRAAEALARLARADSGEPLIVAAALSSLTAENVPAFIARLLASSENATADAERVLAAASAVAAGYGRQDLAGQALVAIVAQSANSPTGDRLSATADLLDSLDRHKLSLSRILASLADKNAEKNISAVFAAARAAAADPLADEGLQLAAARLLGRGPDGRAEDVARLGKLLVPRTPGSVQGAAVAALARLSDPSTPKLLLAGWKGHGPALRAQILDALLARDAWTKDLLAALESGHLVSADVDAARRQRLLNHKNAELKTAAEKLLSATADSDRGVVLAEYESALSLAGDFARGAALFGKKCASCHELGKQGKPVGPNLAALNDKSGRVLLTAILDPNRAVEPKYTSYTAVLADGRILVGMVADETGGGLTLVDQNGNRHALLRSELEELQSSGKSLMPEGLEKELSPQELADVIAYVQAGGRPK